MGQSEERMRVQGKKKTGVLKKYKRLGQFIIDGPQTRHRVSKKAAVNAWFRTLN